MHLGWGNLSTLVTTGLSTSETSSDVSLGHLFSPGRRVDGTTRIWRDKEDEGERVALPSSLPDEEG